jgi:hypothetical protein
MKKFTGIFLRNSLLRITFFVVLSSTLSSCAFFAETFTASKTYSLKQTPLGITANKYFWDNFHQGNYDSINNIVNNLLLALNENPNDLKTTVHLGFTHVWAVSERQRIQYPTPEVMENLFLARRYFTEGYTMNDNDPRILGFMADMELAEGQIFNNNLLQVHGYFDGMKAINMWPQFNKFTIGYAFSQLDSKNERYNQAVEWQYETVNDCACYDYEHNIKYKEMSELIKKSTDPDVKRACWNGWIAPHNFEGFFLNFGDMLVKKGNWGAGIEMYKAAKLSDSYAEWPYKDMLEERIIYANENVKNFNAPLNEQNLSSQKVILFNSKAACMSCHQMSPSEFIKYGDKEPGETYYFIDDN